MGVYDVADGASYKDYRDTVHNLEFHVHDLTQGSEHHERPEAIALRSNLRSLREALEQKHPARDIERRLMTIEQDLERAKHQPSPTPSNKPFVQYEHIDDLHDRVKGMRLGVRNFSGW